MHRDFYLNPGDRKHKISTYAITVPNIYLQTPVAVIRMGNVPHYDRIVFVMPNGADEFIEMQIRVSRMQRVRK